MLTRDPRDRSTGFGPWILDVEKTYLNLFGLVDIRNITSSWGTQLTLVK